MIKVEQHEVDGDRLGVTEVEINLKYEKVTSEDIPFRYLQKLKSMGFSPIRVPIRQTGISSEGEDLHCHVNVMKMVKKYGGGRLEGHELTVFEEEKCLVGKSHSVWITPEYNVTCITKSNYLMDEGGTRCLEKGYTVFIPRVLDTKCVQTSYFRHFDFGIHGNTFGLMDDDSHPVQITGRLREDLKGSKIQNSENLISRNDWKTSKQLMKFRRQHTYNEMWETNTFLNSSQRKGLEL